IRYFFTDSARASDSRWLAAALPVLSVWPTTMMTSVVTPWSFCTRSSSFAAASRSLAALAVANRTSVANVTFSLVGCGGAGGRGAGGGGGGGAGGGGGGGC